MEEEYQIDLLDLLKHLRKRIVLLVLATVVGGVAAFLISALLLTPQYTATTRAYVLNQSTDNAISTSDLQTASQLTSDYQVLITGTNVARAVISELNLDMNEEQLISSLNVSAVTNTRIIQIEVTNSDPEQAAAIANCVRRVASEQIVSIMGVDAVNTVYDASVPEKPSAPSKKKNTAIGALLALALVLGICVLTYLLDDSIKNEDDVERYLQLNTIGIIPKENSVAKEKRGKK